MIETQRNNKIIRYISLLLSILMIFSSFPLLDITANAQTEVETNPPKKKVISTAIHSWGWLKCDYKWNYTNSRGQEKKFITTTGADCHFIHIDEEKNNKIYRYPLFCIEPGVPLRGADGSVFFVDNKENFWKLTTTQKELIGAIIYYSGIGPTDLSVDPTASNYIGNNIDYMSRYAAAQILIWEIVTGMRYGKDNDADPGARKTNAIPCDAIYGQRSFVGTDIRNPNSIDAGTTAFKNAYKNIINNAKFAIKQEIQLNQTKITLQYDKSKNKYTGSVSTTTVERGLSLNNYKLSSNNSNVTATKNGNKIDISSSKPNIKAKITLTPKRDNADFKDGSAKICVYQNQNDKNTQTLIKPISKVMNPDPTIEVTVPNAVTMEIEKKFYLSNNDGIERKAGTSTTVFAVKDSSGKFVKVSGDNPLNYIYNGSATATITNLPDDCKIHIAEENNKYIFRIKNLPVNTYYVHEVQSQNGYVKDNTVYEIKDDGSYVKKQTIKNYSNELHIKKQWIFPKGIGEQKPEDVEIHVYDGTNATAPTAFICLNEEKGYYRPATDLGQDPQKKVTELKLGTVTKDIRIYALPNNNKHTWVVKEAYTSKVLQTFTSNAYDTSDYTNGGSGTPSVAVAMAKDTKRGSVSINNTNSANNEIVIEKLISESSSNATDAEKRSMYNHYRGYIQCKANGDSVAYLKLEQTDSTNKTYKVTGTTDKLTADCKFALNNSHKSTITEIPDGTYTVCEDETSIADHWRIVKGQETVTLDGGVTGKTINVTHKNEYILNDLIIKKEVKDTKGNSVAIPAGILFRIKDSDDQYVDLVQTAANEYTTFDTADLSYVLHGGGKSSNDTYDYEGFRSSWYTIRKININNTASTYTLSKVQTEVDPVSLSIVSARGDGIPQKSITKDELYNGFQITNNGTYKITKGGTSPSSGFDGAAIFEINDDRTVRLVTQFAKLRPGAGDTIIIKGLEEGQTYTIEEITPKDVFVPKINSANNITKPEQSVTITNNGGSVTFENELNKNSLTINKTSFNKEVRGVKFQITRSYVDKSGTTVKDTSYEKIVFTRMEKENTSAANDITKTVGYITVDLDTYYMDIINRKLYPYTYTIKELSDNPECIAYYVPQTKTWKTTSDAKAVDFNNPPISGNLKIIKKMKKIEDGQEVFFPNVKFTITSDFPSDNSNLVYLYNSTYLLNVITSREYTTDANGEINISGLPVVCYDPDTGEERQIIYTITEQTTDGVNETFNLADDENVILEYPVEAATIAAARQTKTVEIINTPKTGKIELTKIDADTKEPVEGCEFTITSNDEPYTIYHINFNDDGEEINRTATTSLIEDTPGHYVLNNIPLGTYKITEKRKTGYLNLVSPSKTIQLTEANPTAFLYTDADRKLQYAKTQFDANGEAYVVQNTPIQRPIQVTKTDKQGNVIEYGGAVFYVYEDTNGNGAYDELVYDEETGTYQGDQQVDTLEYDETNKVYKSTKQFRLGTYFVKEIDAPPGYIVNNTVYKATVTNATNQSGVVISFTIPNTIIYGDFRATKIDSQTKELLAGANFVLYEDINKNQAYDEGIDTVAKMYDITNNNAESDAVVRGLTGTYKGIYKLPTGNKLKYGNYLLIETNAPAGHKLNAVNTYPFVIADTTTVDVHPSITIDMMDDAPPEDNKITNQPIEATIVIKKQDPNGIALKNVQFGLYDSTNTIAKQIVGEKTLIRQYDEETQNYVLTYDESTISYVDQKKSTNTNGRITFAGVRYGTYTLKETFPSNYLSDATYSYTDPTTNTVKTGHLTSAGLNLNVTNAWDGKTIALTIVNTPTRSKLIKESPDDGVVSNITFTIRKKGTSNVLYTRKTDANGEIDISDIPVGQYTAREENVPNSKIANPAEQDFEIKTNQTTTLLFTNKIKKANITILKVKEGTTTPISGCKFALYKKGTNGAADELVEEVTTKSTGKAAFQTVAYGDYYIKETFVPEGYALSKSQWDISTDDFSATEEVTTFPLTIENTPQKINFSLHKYDSESNAPIKDAEFTLYRTSDDAVMQVKKTNASGNLSFENLGYDDYYVKETESPEGYVKLDTTWTITKNNFTKNEPITVMAPVNVPEPIQKIRIKVIKSDSMSNSPVKDAKFAVYNSSGTKLQEVTTNVNGEATFNDLPYGTYTMKETYAPPGYVKNTTVWNITKSDFTEQVALSTKTIPVTESNQKIQIKVTKTDDTNTPVENATFYLYKADGTKTTVKATTNAQGIAEFPVMYYSEFADTDYYIQEYSAPAKYVINTTKFNITKQDFTANVENNVKDIPVTEKRKHITVKIHKTDSETNIPIQNAVFGLYRDSDSTLLERATTNANGEAEFSEQLFDTYYVKELSVPPAYVRLTTKWTITKKTDFAPNEEHIIKVLEVSEPSRKITVKINKKDAKTNSPIKDAVFGLYKSADNTLVESKETDANGELTFSDVKYADLDPTGYYVQEISVPDGYEKLDTKWNVTTSDFTANQEYTAKNIDVSEPVQKIRISVTKTKENTTTPVPGAVFGLYNASNDALISSKTTNNSGKLTFPDQDYGDYYVKEIEAPEGYILNTTKWNVGKTDFTKDIALTPKDIPVTEKEQTIQVSVYKKDSRKQTPVKNAVLGLFKGTSTTPIETKTTNSSGKVTFSKIKYTDIKNNNYYIKEIEAPEGFVRVDDEIPITTSDFDPELENTTVNKELLEPKKYIIVKIHKMKADDTSVPIPGAKFTLYRADNSVVATKTTDTNGNIEFDQIVYGDYYVKETYVPEGYVINPDTWNITKTTDFAENIEVAAKQIDVPETPQQIKISVVKKDSVTKTPISGVKFRLYNADTNDAIETKITNTEGKLTFTTQEYGNYYVKEISAPPAYFCDTTQRWDITTNDFEVNTALTPKEITVEDPPKDLTVEVVKLKSGTAEPVPGAVFGLYEKNGTQPIASVTTGTDGKATFPAQKYSADGYTLKEESVPNGFVLLTTTWDITAEDFGSNKQHITKRINVDEPEQKIRITVVKKDNITSVPIQGVVFDLYKVSTDGTSDTKIQTETTNADGKLTFSDQPYGNYYIKESYTPPEYVSPAANKRWDVTTDMFTANIELTKKTFTIKNTPKQLVVELIKTDSTTGQTIPVKDAVFTLYNKEDDSVIESKTTDANGKLSFTAQLYGEYYVKETQAPPGYALLNDIWNITINDFSPNKATIKKTINASDPKQKIDISIVKTIKGTTTPLADAVFSLYKNDGTFIESQRTNRQGKASFTRQLYGEYYIKETEAPEGYACLDTTWNVTLDDFTVNEEISAKVINASDTPQTISVKVFKYETVNNTRTPVGNAEFTLYRKSDNVAVETKTTAANGYLTFSTQAYGDYYVKETKAPEGYAINNHTWNVKAGSLRAAFPVTQQVLSRTLNVDETQQDIEVKIIKKSDKGNIPIEGAVFSLYSKDTDALITSATTDVNGEATFERQPYGEYYVKETYVPAKYVKLTTIVGEITKNDFVTGQALSQKEIQVVNKEKQLAIEIYKIDSEKRTPIQGAEFTLYNKDTNVAIETKTTNENGKITFTRQGYGNYYVKETNSPPYYVMVKTTYNILNDTFNQNSEVIYKNITVEEPLQKLSVSIKKTEEGSTTPIEGAVFAMYRKSDNEKVDEKSTNENGELTFDAQVCGKYYIKEIATPDQYVLLDDQWEIDENDFDKNLELSTKSINVINTPVKIKIYLHKADNDGEAVQGAKFGLYTEEGKLISTKITNENGNADFPQQTIGSYFVREISVPDGYVLDAETKYLITPDDFGKNVPVSIKRINATNDKMTIKVNVQKNDAENGSPVANAVFGLYKTDGTEIERQQTDVTGALSFSEQDYGNYYVQEISVPDKYVLLSTKWDITKNDFTINQKLSVKNITVEEPQKKLTINLVKYDAASNKTVKLSGAVFSLYKKGSTQPIKSATTNANGTASFGTQLYGEYYLKETKAPEGYVLDSTVYNITIDMFTGNETTIPVKTIEAVNKEQKIKVSVVKTEKGTTTPIQNAVFGLYKLAGSTETKIAEKTTDKDGKLSFDSIGYTEIKNNSYYIKEISVPDKYVLLTGDAGTWTITTDDFEINTENTVKNIEVEEPEKMISVQLIKYNGVVTSRIKGATFSLFAKDSTTAIESKITNNNGELTFSNQPYGEYYIKETKAPSGFAILDGQWDITLNDFTEDELTIKQIFIDETDQEIEIKVVKNEEGTNNPVENAVFGLYKADGTEIERKETNANGRITFTRQPYGSYYVQEISVPDKYVLLDTQWPVTENDFIIGQALSTKEIAVQEPVKKLKLQVTKTKDGTTEPVKNAKFGLYAENGDPIETKTTDSSGKLTFSDQKYGKYYIKEISVPNGYVLLDTMWQIDLADFSDEAISTKAINVNEPYYEINVIKTSSDGNVTNIPFEITKENDTTFQKQTIETDENGKIDIQGITKGTYIIKEIVPDGYVCDSQNPQKVTLSETNPHGIVRFNNTKMIPLKIIKSSDDNIVNGMQFTIEGIDGTNYAKTTMTTATVNNQDGVIAINLKAGKYRITEINRAARYKSDDSQTQDVTITDQDTNKVVYVYNHLNETGFSINKTELFTHEPIKDAVFVIKQTNTTNQWTVITDASGHADLALTYGDYTYQETSVPDGYKLDTTIHSFTINSNDGYTANVTNTGIGSFKIRKVDSYTGKPIQNVTFKLRNADSSYNKTAITTEDGYAEFNNIEFGEYFYSETNAPDGYEFDATEKKVTVNTNTAPVTITVENRPFGKFSVTKIDAKTKQPIKDVTFRLRNESGSYNKTAITDDSGIATFQNLDLGKYFYSETNAPEGYIVDNTEREITISSANESKSITMENTGTGSLELQKIDARSKQPIKDVTFRLRNSDKSYDVRRVTEENGIALFENLPYGTYFYSEIDAPEGYIFDGSEHEIEITTNGQTIRPDPIENTGTGSLEITKVDADSDEPIAGVTFRLRNSDNSYNKTATTGINGIARFDKIPYGTYLYSEIDAPEGYIFDSTERSISITENDQVIRPDAVTNTGTGSLTLKKIDASTKQPIANVAFRLRSSDNSYNETKITDANGLAIFENLTYGKYFYSETAAPEGYIFSTDEIEIEISKNGQTIEPEPIENVGQGSLVINKTDISTGDPIANVSFKIRNANDEVIFEGKTDTNGNLTFQNLIYGKYTYQESDAPEGYIINEEKIPFEIKQNGEIIRANVKNTGTGKIILTKEDISTGEKLPGCGIEITDMNGKVLVKGETNGVGVIEFDALPYGKYYYREYKAPENYLLDDTFHEFEIKTNGQIIRATLKDRLFDSPDTSDRGKMPLHTEYAIIFFIGFALTATVVYKRRKKNKTK